jgi:hypothetical protein
MPNRMVWKKVYANWIDKCHCFCIGDDVRDDGTRGRCW